ncbi:unnamed protein product [Urochloa decumbens]|uniref:Subtilisin-like protease n=1 Tax=Urochloa decumbens TaxID=240449 RepID=A0ABC9EAE7_9POAL
MATLAMVWVLSLLAVAAVASAELETEDHQSSYVVHVAAEHAPPPSSRPHLLTSAYTSFLRDNLPEHIQRPEPMLLHTYAHAATGFAARLTGSQAAHLASLPSVLAVTPDAVYQLYTTLTPSFLGLYGSGDGGLLPVSGAASGVVIGVVDSGVYPDGRASFAADPSLPPPPARFRGGCVSAPSFDASVYCNNKLVGAKFFSAGYEATYGPLDASARSPLDTGGHGTHTASTAAGSAVADASLFDYARGTAVGIAPGARIAAYKVCWEKGCALSDILAGFDEAISDNVDVISASLGAVGQEPELHEDLVAIGAFSAVRRGIVVSAAAGNDGPGEYTVKNGAPWFITVGASTINRRFEASVVLGNGDAVTGASLYVGQQTGQVTLPLVYSKDAGSESCEDGMLNPNIVSGRIVLCDAGRNHGSQAKAVRLAGGAGVILTSLQEYGEQTLPTAHVIPTVTVTFAGGVKIWNYIKAQRSPVATIVLHGTIIGWTPPSPRMASFSNRGPYPHAPEILKPDLTAPGVDILAAWTSPVQFNIISGTSMACPHVSGVAAMLRQARPGWSPAAIRSAMMTTAYNLDSSGGIIGDMATGQASTPFVRGAGHVNPNRALNPGLVYDADADDYISFLCALGYTSRQIAIFTRDGTVTDCSRRTGSVGDLNYPAFSVVFGSDFKAVTQRRAVRNVGSDVVSVYTASVTSPAGVRVTVSPGTLVFTSLWRTLEYEVTFTPEGGAIVPRYTFGSIVWSDGQHQVTSPIAITWPVSQPVAAV